MTSTVPTWSAPVRWSETDAQGIVFNAYYLTYCDEALGAFCAQRGISAFADRVNVVHANLDWSAPLRHGDQVRVDVCCARIGRTSLTIGFRIGSATGISCSGEITYVYTDSDGRPAPLPEQVRAALS